MWKLLSNFWPVLPVIVIGLGFFLSFQNGIGNHSNDVSTEARIADYTGWLAIFTCALVLVSGLQIYFLIRADKTARISADAAKESSDAIVSSERPHVFFEDLKMDGFYLTPSQEGQRRLYGRTMSFDPVYPVISCKIRNRGKSPAWIKTVAMRHVLAAELPQIPDHGENPKIYNGRGFPIHQEEGLICADQRLQPSPELKHEDWMLVAGKKLYLFYGVVEYSDIFGKAHKSCCAWRYVTPGGSEEGLRFDPDGSATYWEYT